MSLNTSTIHSSPVQPIGWLGGERALVLIALTITIYFGFIYAMSVGLLEAVVVPATLWTFFMFILTRMGKYDMQLCSVWWRHRKYRTYYPAKGRLDAIPRDFGAFIGK